MDPVENGGGDQPWQLQPEERVECFIIKGRIGGGGMGEVYLAKEIPLDRLVALKVIKNIENLPPVAVNRFMREAMNTVKAPHPNIVVVYRCGQISREGGITLPYVALEYLEGGDLAERISSQDLKIEEILTFARDITAGLRAAHNAGIHHRDLKPANVVLDGDGRPRVVDFGLAKAFKGGAISQPSMSQSSADHDSLAGVKPYVSQDGNVCGTPPYMAPEQWRGERTGPRTDVWALGIMLYEMIAYRHPFEGQNLRQEACGTSEVDYTPLDRAPPALVKIVQDCLERVMDQRPDAAAVMERLEGLLQGQPRVSSSEGPYRGLLPFEEHHERLFFGRDQEIGRCLSSLESSNILTLMGSSGAGKSSLVKAGLLPRLRKDGDICLVNMRPGREPFKNLAEPLVTRLQETDVTMPSVAPGGVSSEEMSSDELANDLRKDPGMVARLLHRLAKDRGQRVLLFIDQLEELVTLVSDQQERRRFLESLGLINALDTMRVLVIQTVREGFVGKLMQGKIGNEPFGETMMVMPPSADLLMETLVRPLRALNYNFEDEALARDMAEEVKGEPACLPLLQFAGQQLWERRDRQRAILCRSVYEAAGGVAGMLAGYADSVVPRIPEREYDLAKVLLLRLVTPEGTREVLREEQLLDGLEQDAVKVLSKLVGGRLVTARQGRSPGQLEYELIHESLLTNWALLAGWIEANDADLRTLLELRREAETWTKEGRPWARLLQGKPLGHALAWQSSCRLEIPPVPPQYSSAHENGHLRGSRPIRPWLHSNVPRLAILPVIDQCSPP